ncbi:MAG: carbohydrate kinase family protein [Chloroflexota bacterium]
MNILITGSVAYDYLMSFPGSFKEHILEEEIETLSLSFLVDSLTRRRGGVAANIGYNLALLGVRAKVFATIGEDYKADRDLLTKKGVDTSDMHIISDAYTASFFVTTDHSNSQIASFYPGAMAHAAELSLNNLDGFNPDLVVVSPNDPAAMVKYIEECKILGWPYLYDPSQQVARVDGETLKEGIEGAQALFANAYEYEIIKKKTGMSEADILDAVDFMAITHGEKGARVYHDDDLFEIPAVLTDRVVDPTGGGDAFRGGFLTGLSYDWDWEMCGKLGALAATFCLESDCPQAHEYSKEDYVERFRQHFEDNGKLDVLLSS